ncbi:sodium:proton antiporter [bacterium]|nr:sodium:proton antiporter [bacterium]
MDITIEHAVGTYIALVGIACLVGIVARWLTHVPYTIALTVVGLCLALFHIGPEIHETGFSKELIFLVFLPPLLFQGAFHMQLDRLRAHAIPVAIFATIGVAASMLLIGGLSFALGVFSSLGIALLFGALICPTDPVSVLAIFREYAVPEDLKYLVEGESLFNDGTGVVLFAIVLSVVSGAHDFHAGVALLEFVKVALGGAIVGVALGYATFLVLRRLHDHLLENAICLVCCYGTFWVAEHFHLSGVIATVAAGLLLGNYGRKLAMYPKTIATVEVFFESIDFLINSILFILIGLELQVIPKDEVIGHLGDLGIAIVVVLVARAIVVYPMFAIGREFFGRRGIYPFRWAHVLNWGGLRGSIPIALLLGLPRTGVVGEARDLLLVLGFGFVCFSLIVQGLTMKPLLFKLGLVEKEEQT